MSTPKLGDIQWKDRDPLETYFDIAEQGVKLPRRKWIVKPEWMPCNVNVAKLGLPPGPAADLTQAIIAAQQEMLECHTLPRLWQLLADFWIKAQCGTYFVKGPNWIEPPVTARAIDARNETLTALDEYGAATTVTSFTVPDRFVGTLLGFGHELNPGATWSTGTVTWNILINGDPAPQYQNFIQQIGEYRNPTRFPSPIRVKHLDEVLVTATTLVAGISATARLIGFMYPVKEVTQDGSYREYHTAF